MVTITVTVGQSDEKLRMDLEAKRDFKPVLVFFSLDVKKLEIFTYMLYNVYNYSFVKECGV